ncbi:MAG: helix-turn-helix domain-containing protein [Enterocloster sp.]
MEIQKDVARNIKNIRERKKITLESAAKLTGVSRSMLAQIEKGEVNPTISILWKIANGYKVSFTSLLSSGASSLLIKAEEVVPLIEDGGKYINRPAFPFQEDKQFETYHIEIKEHGFLQAQPHLEGAEEFITVFEGEVEIVADTEFFQLKKGDSLRFKADVAHSYKNIGSTTAYLSMIIYYSNN